MFETFYIEPQGTGENLADGADSIQRPGLEVRIYWSAFLLVKVLSGRIAVRYNSVSGGVYFVKGQAFYLDFD